jgi:hypothetical protein
MRHMHVKPIYSIRRELPMKLMNVKPIYSIWKMTLAVVLGVLLLSTALSAQEAPGVPSHENQLAAVGSLHSINTAEAYYAKEYGKGFSSTLAALGVPPDGTKVSATAAGLLNNSLTGGTKNNFVFKYSAGPQDADGKITAYTVTAQPVTWQKGVKSFFTDQTGVIRGTDQNHPPTASDPAL